MMTNHYILSVIDTLREGWYDPPTSYQMKKIDFEYASYRRTALDEIKFYLLEEKKEDPIKMIEDFRQMMDDFACQTKNGTANFMFSTYYDTATDVLDVLLSMK